jgi:hypothetical protein
MSGSSRIVPLPTKAQRIQSYQLKRVCAEGECSTVLSIYNSAEYCWVHERPRHSSTALQR